MQGTALSKTHQEHGDTGYLEDQRAFFDRLITQDWETYLSPHWDRVRQLEVQEILRLLPAPPKRVLDVGCGCGYHDVQFARHAGVERVVGIDYSEKSIEQASTHYPHPRVERYVADIFDEGQSGGLGRFDLVASFQVLEHLSRPHEFLARCADLAAAGGHVAVVTPNRLRAKNRLRLLLGRPPRMIDPLHFAEYTIDEVVAMGQGIGLRAVGFFGHTISLEYGSLHIIRGQSALGMWLGRRFPRWASVMGVVMHKSS